MRRVKDVASFWKRVQGYQQDALVNGTWRQGQLYFNALYDVDPELANEVRGTTIDPFYRDDKIESFMIAIL
mgnify:FL=1